jgi:YD repeat-containing protein
MSEEVIKDKNGYVLAKLETNGTTTIMYDKYHNRIAQFDSNEGYTRDKYGNKIGNGNLLMTLLPRSN